MDRLVASVQHYEWGDPWFIPAFQRRPATGAPEAELWLGTHHRGPATLERDGRPLATAIATDPEGTLGETVAARFGRLPFLAKVLAAGGPLSIQAHPTSEQAAEGFQREEQVGVPLDSPERVYPDPSHKPELICALTRFEAKCGFRPLDETRELFGALEPALAPVTERLGASGRDDDVLREVLAWLLRTGEAEAATLVAAAVAAADGAPRGGPHDAALAWTGRIARDHPGDIGVVVALLLNHVELEPGQAVFLRAGNLHCYLQGAGIEIMASSDNVVRGALTSKHVAVDELLAIVDCAPAAPPVQTANGCLHTFHAPVPEFSLTRVCVGDDTRLRVRGPEVLVVTDGVVEITTQSGQVLAAEAGDALWVPASDGCYLIRGGGILYRAAVGAS